MRRFRHKINTKDKFSQSAHHAVNGFLGFLQFDPTLYPVFDMWDREIRPYLRGCQAVALQGKKICVRVPSAVHQQELMFHKNHILDKINQAMGRRAITDIQFEFSHEKGGHV